MNVRKYFYLRVRMLRMGGGRSAQRGNMAEQRVKQGLATG